jgi:hypothetical protein
MLIVSAALMIAIGLVGTTIPTMCADA